MDKLNVLEKIIETETSLNKAYESNDTKKISEFLSDEWTMLESTTGLTDKEHFISAIQSGRLIHQQMTKTIQQIKIKDNFAVVISKGINKGKYLDSVFNAENWITNVYVFENDKWICFMTSEIPAGC